MDGILTSDGTDASRHKFAASHGKSKTLCLHFHAREIKLFKDLQSLVVAKNLCLLEEQCLLLSHILTVRLVAENAAKPAHTSGGILVTPLAARTVRTRTRESHGDEMQFCKGFFWLWPENKLRT